MPMMVLTRLIPPETYEAWRAGLHEYGVVRREEYTAARARQGVLRQGVFVLQTPAGPMEIMVMDAEDPGRALQMMATSEEPFDVEFRGFLKDTLGLDLTDPPTSDPVPELVLDWTAPARSHA